MNKYKILKKYRKEMKFKITKPLNGYSRYRNKIAEITDIYFAGTEGFLIESDDTPGVRWYSYEIRLLKN